MSVGKAIYARLSAHAGVSALVGTRIYPLKLPQGPTYPAIRYQQVSGPREHAMGADTGEVHARVQVDCWALTFAGAEDLATQVRLALSRFGGTAGGVVVEHIFLDNEIDGFDPEANRTDGREGVYRVMLDFIVHHEE